MPNSGYAIGEDFKDLFLKGTPASQNYADYAPPDTMPTVDPKKERDDPTAGTYDFGPNVGRVVGMKVNGRPATRDEALAHVSSQRTGLGGLAADAVSKHYDDLAKLSAAREPDAQMRSAMKDLAYMGSYSALGGGAGIVSRTLGAAGANAMGGQISDLLEGGPTGTLDDWLAKRGKDALFGAVTEGVSTPKLGLTKPSAFTRDEKEELRRALDTDPYNTNLSQMPQRRSGDLGHDLEGTLFHGTSWDKADNVQSEGIKAQNKKWFKSKGEEPRAYFGTYDDMAKNYGEVHGGRYAVVHTDPRDLKFKPDLEEHLEDEGPVIPENYRAVYTKSDVPLANIKRIDYYEDGELHHSWTPSTPKSSIEAGSSGTAAGAKSDTELYQQAKQELGPNAGLSEVLNRAQELKTGNVLTLRKFGVKHGDTVVIGKPGESPYMEHTPYEDDDGHTSYDLTSKTKDGKIIGWMTYKDTGLGILKVREAQVSHDFMGKGEGTKLYQTMIDHAKELGYKKVESDFVVSSDAQRLWERLGAKNIGTDDDPEYSLDLTKYSQKLGDKQK